MPRIMLPLAIPIAFLSACTASFKAPKSAYSEVGALEASNYEVTSAYNNSIYRWPGLTWSISGTYLPGEKRAAQVAHEEFSFTQRGRGQFALEVSAPDSCRSSEPANRQLADALKTLLNEVGGFPSSGGAKVSIVGENTSVARYSMSLHTGRSYALQYWTPCIHGSGDTALFYGAMIALHESTHASLDMLGAQANTEKERERVAVGASACLYLGLGREDATFSRRYDVLLDIFRHAARLGETSIDLTDLCGSWKARVRTVSR